MPVQKVVVSEKTVHSVLRVVEPVAVRVALRGGQGWGG